MGTHRLSIPLYNTILLVAGDEKETAMRRTEISISDRLYNMIPIAPMNRRSTGSLRDGLQIKGSDVDILYYPTDHHVVWDSEDSHMYNPCTETVFLAEYQEFIPGTVYLRLLTMHPSNNSLTKRSCIEKDSLTYLSSELHLREADGLYYGHKVFKHGPCQTNTINGNEYDGAVGFAARKWPTPQTMHWLTRCEKFGWPQKEVLENILSSGCHFVSIGSKQSRYENNPSLELEWRLSFNQAEQKLVDSMTHCQFLCYALLKIFLKDVLNKNVKEEEKLLCSYFLKTALFWCIQTDPKHEWSRENFYCCFWKCFKILLHWVYTGYCPNFFIPENNLFVCMIVGANQERLFTRMYEIYCLRERCLAKSPFLGKIVADLMACRVLSPDERFDDYLHDAVLHHTMISINTLQNQELKYDWKSLYKVYCMDVSNMSNFEQVLIQRHVLNLYNQIAFVEQYCCTCRAQCTRNKQTYGKHKKVGERLLRLTAEFGCATDPLYLALFLYNDGRFRCALNILEETRKKLYKDHILYWDELESTKPAYRKTMIGQPMSVKIKETMAYEIHLILSVEFSELDVEIVLLRESKLRRTLAISPYVFLRFLIFLCHHRLHSPLSDRSLQELHSLVHADNGRYIASFTRDIAWDILGICHSMAGNLDKALIAYQTSLQQTPINYITEATKFRILLLGSELKK